MSATARVAAAIADGGGPNAPSLLLSLMTRLTPASLDCPPTYGATLSTSARGRGFTGRHSPAAPRRRPPRSAGAARGATRAPAPPAAGRRRTRSRPRHQHLRHRAARITAQDGGPGLEAGRGQRLRQAGAADVERHLQAQQRAVGAARIGRHRADQQRLHLGRTLGPRRPERQPCGDVDARVVLVQQRRPPGDGRRLALGRHRQYGGGGGAGADLADRLTRRAVDAQRRQRAEMLARGGGVGGARIGIAHRQQQRALQRRAAADQLPPDPHQADRRKAAGVARQQPPDDRRLAAGAQRHPPLVAERADLSHDSGTIHQQVVQGVIQTVEFLAQRSQRRRRAGCHGARANSIGRLQQAGHGAAVVRGETPVIAPGSPPANRRSWLAVLPPGHWIAIQPLYGPALRPARYGPSATPTSRSRSPSIAGPCSTG